MYPLISRGFSYFSILSASDLYEISLNSQSTISRANKSVSAKSPSNKPEKNHYDTILNLASGKTHPFSTIVYE